jgi:hypothetical protein
MKLTTQILKKLIKEELESVIQENYPTDHDQLKKDLDQRLKNKEIDYGEYNYLLKKIGKSRGAQYMAQQAAHHQRDLANDPNLNKGLFQAIHPDNLGDDSTKQIPSSSTYVPSKQEKAKIQELSTSLEMLQKTMAGDNSEQQREALLQKIADTDVYGNREKVYADMATIRQPHSPQRLKAAASRIKKSLDSLSQSQEKPKKGFLSRFFSEE